MSRLPTFEDNDFLTQIAGVLLPRLACQERESSPGWRIWSIGCQAGDEALLLLLSLHYHQQQVPASSSPFTVFATDADVQAVTRARRLTASDHLEKIPSLAPYQSLLLREWDGLSLPEAWPGTHLRSSSLAQRHAVSTPGSHRRPFLALLIL